MRDIYIYIYIYIYAEGHVVELAPPHTQKCLGFKGENVQIAGVREKMFKLRD